MLRDKKVVFFVPLQQRIYRLVLVIGPSVFAVPLVEVTRAL
jgi:hypothetical protein